MPPIQWFLIAILVVGVAIGAYALLAPRRTPAPLSDLPQPATGSWTHEAGDEFSGLSEAARCDVIFAMGALDDDRSRRLLESALDDPSEVVALAAAHALAASGRAEAIQTYAQRVPGPRAQRLLDTVALLG
ncbi:MAG TPA: HEAT repeat domain-containing protein [Candidatus Baltobacteraceae bacterium]